MTVIHANMTLILTVLTLFYDIAARFPIAIQEETLLKDLEAFFARIHLFYRGKPSAQSLFRVLLLRVKERAVFQRQRMDPSLGMYSFRLLELLRGGKMQRWSPVEPDLDTVVTVMKLSHISRFTRRSSIAEPGEYKSNIAKNRSVRPSD